MIFDELVKSASEFPVAVNAVRNPDVILKQFLKKKKLQPNTTLAIEVILLAYGIRFISQKVAS